MITKKTKICVVDYGFGNIASIENEIGDKIGMRVYVNNKKNNSGTLTFQYKSLDQMERLIQVIKNNY